MTSFFKNTYQQWMEKRLPASAEVELTQKRLFVLPSRHGLYFLGVLILILLVGINYQNNLAYALCFFLFSLFLSAILLTFFNLKGLTIEVGQTPPVFVGETAEFGLRLKKSSSGLHHRLQLGFKAQSMVVCDLVAEHEILVSLPHKATRRGRFHPDRFFIKTHYPLGMVTCWSTLRMPLEALVYPTPIFKAERVETAVEGNAERQSYRHGDDDFYGFKAYEVGDSLNRLHWRSLAKGQPLTTKVYQSGQDTACWVDWYALDGGSIEEKLSLLCGQIVIFYQSNQSFGLRLPGVELQPDSSITHYHSALTALALYP